jgi:hypothetical protein
MANDIMVPKRRGRPPKALKEQQAQSLANVKHLSDEEVLALVQSRFEVLARQSRGTSDASVRGLIVSGAAGIGKSHTVLTVLEGMRDKGEVKHLEKVSGHMSAVHLFMLLYRNRFPGSVVVIDDADAIYADDSALNILKAALDTNKRREISWFSDSAVLKAENVDNQFVFEGSVIFITNLNFDGFLAAGKNRLSPHIEALMSRSLYLDLKLHDRRAVMLWIEYLISKTHLLVHEFGITEAKETEIVEFLKKHHLHARVLSVRTAVLVGGIVKANPESWQEDARILLLKD